LRTLYSRAHRIGLDGSSCLLSGLRKQPSFDLVTVVIVGTVTQPASELFIFPEQELERFAHHVRRSCVDELSVVLQFQFDFFLEANLKGCSFRFFWMVLSAVPYLFPPFLALGMYYELHYKMFVPTLSSGKNGTRPACRAGGDPTTLFGRLKAEKVGSLPPAFEFFPRRLLSSLAFVFLRHPRTFDFCPVKTLAIPKVQGEFVTTSLDLHSFLARNRQRAQRVGHEGDGVFAIIRAKPVPHLLGANQAHLPATI